jgi:asparagine synthase (glutamine-hydrolysing)
MCGIVVVRDLEHRPVAPEIVARMVATLLHRGPDDEGLYTSDVVGLGFRRLAILDLTSAGHQPMESPDGKVVLVFNGQIFNYVELRQELRALGHAFRSTGDTEVLLHAYLEWGRDCLPRLNGEWAFIFWDGRDRTLFGSRDRFGVKPMYRTTAGGRMAWASEIKALLTLPGLTPEINWAVSGRYLREGRMDDSAETFFQGIEAVSPGHAFVVQPDGREERWCYWSIADPDEGTFTGDPAPAFAELLEDAVRLRLRSDVPVGLCLSGGLDSTSIICAAHRLRQAEPSADETLSAFVYHHPEFDERRYVAATLEQTGAHPYRLELDHYELWQQAERVVRAQDEPLHSLTAIVGYQLMAMIAGTGHRVALGGQGADEVLAGYGSFFLDAWYTQLRQGRPRRAFQEIGAYVEVHGGSARELAVRAVRRLIQGQFQSSTLYRRAAHRRQRRREVTSGWFTGAALPDPSRVPEPIPLRLGAALHRATTIDPLPLYLRLEDRNSMAHSVDVRLPFLDHRLVEMAFSLGPDWKIQGPWNKVVLREAMRGRIPEIVRTRPDKMGFPSPNASLLRSASFERLYGLISSRRARERGIYQWDRMVGELQASRDRDNLDLGLRFFRVAQFELWASIHGI